MKNKFSPTNPNYLEVVKNKLKGQAFMHLMDFNLTKIEPGYVIGQLQIKNKHKQQDGYVHGGVMATTADIVMGFAAFTLVGEKDRIVTINLDMNFINPGYGEILIAEGCVLKAGNKIFYCEASIYTVNNGIKSLTNKVSSTMYKI